MSKLTKIIIAVILCIVILIIFGFCAAYWSQYYHKRDAPTYVSKFAGKRTIENVNFTPQTGDLLICFTTDTTLAEYAYLVATSMTHVGFFYVDKNGRHGEKGKIYIYDSYPFKRGVMITPMDEYVRDYNGILMWCKLRDESQRNCLAKSMEIIAEEAGIHDGITNNSLWYIFKEANITIWRYLYKTLLAIRNHEPDFKIFWCTSYCYHCLREADIIRPHCHGSNMLPDHLYEHIRHHYERPVLLKSDSYDGWKKMICKIS